MPTHNIRMELPNTGNAQAGYGPVQNFPTFRYHPGGNISFSVDRIGTATGHGTIQHDHSGAGVAIGIRDNSGVQRARAEWQPGQRGTKSFGSRSAGNYALNARIKTNTFHSNGVFGVIGRLHMAVVNPV